MEKSKYKVCTTCHIAFDAKQKKCPECHRVIDEEKTSFYIHKEGEGRKHWAGGKACDYCPHCYGNADWCPLLD